jgi:hypothetical protein
MESINWTIQEAILLLEILQHNTRSVEQKELTAMVTTELEKLDTNELDKCAEYICGL